jgi:prepilin-type N-terminal cleavage/methylation domain-containing protein
MKITCLNWFETGGSRPLWRGGFTLPEMMVAMTIFIMSIGMLIAVHIFGGRLFELSKAKLGASDEARTSLAYLLDEVRTNDLILVGTGDASSFTSVVDGVSQIGNAIQIHPSNSLACPTYVRYYMDAANFQLCRIRNGETVPTTIVHAVTNYNVFTSEDALGTVLTNNNNNRVIGVFMQITQLYSPLIHIQTGGLFDYYQLRVKATRRQL